MLEQKGLTRADLAEVMGGCSRVSDFFSGKRDSSKNQAIALSDFLGISLDVLRRRERRRAERTAGGGTSGRFSRRMS